MSYKEYKSINFYDISIQVQKYWDDNNIFQKTISSRNKDSKNFIFYEGPPSANGEPGIHHVMSRTVKDVFCRYKTLKGFKVVRKGGWDTHGLPVELQVEKKLNINKDDIGNKISVEDYNKECRKTVMEFKNKWEELTIKMGYWLDLKDSYITYKNEYIESIWWSLKNLYEKGLLYKGYTIQPFSPAAGTGLSSHELNMPGAYKNIKDTSIVGQFKLLKNKSSINLFKNINTEIYLLAWTTTPWTLPANNSLAVNENMEYSIVKTINIYTNIPVTVILASSCISRYFENKNLKYELLKKIKGKDLLGFDYEQLLDYVPAEKPAFTIVHADFVSADEGTGIVHISRTFGSDDFFISEKYNIPGIFVKDEKGNNVPIVDKSGKFVKEIKDFSGMSVKNFGNNEELSTDIQIAIKLKKENKAFLVEKYEHSYPHCWRTDKPILYYPLESWFIATTKFKNELIQMNKEINWQPESTGSGRFGNWLENIVDWNLSRSRYWGTPLPIWTTENGDEEICIGSIKELKDEVKNSVKAGFMKNKLPDGFDLHRPYIDDIILVSKSGKKMKRQKDIIDVWFDSGAMPFAQHHYPFSNKKNFDKLFPADFIAEGVDQTRGWFFTLHVLGVLLFNKISYKNVISNGLVLDSIGNKMSKRLGNAIDPFKTIFSYGPDPTRWYMMFNSNPWENLKFTTEGIEEVKRKFFGTLFNTYNFFALYANIDKFSHKDHKANEKEKTESDMWILSKLNSTILNVEKNLDNYDPTKAIRLIQNFLINDLSNWYVRLNRKRFWKGEFNKDKVIAYQTLYECLKKISIISSPFAPFYCEKIYLDLHLKHINKKDISVHLSDFPKPNIQLINENLEEKMLYAQQISSLVHSLRKKEKIKVRQPLDKMIIQSKSKSMEKSIKSVEDLILSEVNIKNLEFINDSSKILSKEIKPNFKEIGIAFGKNTQLVADSILQFNKKDIDLLEKNKKITLSISQIGEISITKDLVNITYTDIPGLKVVSNDNFTIAIDINISENLKMEGFARDFVNKVQNVRKEKKFEVTDKVELNIFCDNKFLIESIKNNLNYVSNEIQAKKIGFIKKENDLKELQINDSIIYFNISKSS